MVVSTWTLLASATRHYPLPGGDLSIDTVTVRIFVDENRRIRIAIPAIVLGVYDDLDAADEAAYAAIQRAYDDSDVDWTAEARALHAAYEEAA